MQARLGLFLDFFYLVSSILNGYMMRQHEMTDDGTRCMLGWVYVLIFRSYYTIRYGHMMRQYEMTGDGTTYRLGRAYVLIFRFCFMNP